ncbi:hypothetical protein B0H10DRAFT_2085742 [Mycena sp. CBHHK59/15]|nr:hypothetical protein B0H10DRAFT_2085742 [Mycena sp. CBHHK59/15]
MSNRPQAVLQPFTHVTSNPGKEILDRLIEAFNIWMNVPMDEKAAISKVVNMEHNASLICDAADLVNCWRYPSAC